MRCNFATSQRDRALRMLEHTTLTRLMYVARNPHRRTPYFTRLEHVRRLLRKISAHKAWKLLDSPTKNRSNSKKGSAKGVRQIDVNRLEELVGHVDNLVTSVIPKTAARWTTELIEREHFVPLATAVVALLARILVLEKPLLRALQSVATEARILVIPTSTETPIEQRKGIVRVPPTNNNSIQQDDEDVGQVITMQEATAQKLTVVANKEKTRKKSGRGRFFQQAEKASTSAVSDGGIVKKRRESAPASSSCIVGTSTAAKAKKKPVDDGEVEDLDSIFADLSD